MAETNRFGVRPYRLKGVKIVGKHFPKKSAPKNSYSINGSAAAIA
jgi:hypothetical protein